MDLPQWEKSFVREDEADQRREDLLREPREESSDRAYVQDYQGEHEKGAPQPDPHAEFQERNGMLTAEVGDELLEYEGGASGPQDHQGLPREDGVEEVAETHS